MKAKGAIQAKKENRKTELRSSKFNSNLLILAGIVFLTFIVFFPMLKNQFTAWDDGDYITNNYIIKSLSWENLKAMFAQPIAYNYHPFTILSLAINYAVSKLNPFSYFLTNLLFHIANSILVYFLALLLSNKNKTVASFVAILFAIHPMHVESVAWASERKDVLYSFFFIGALIAWYFFIDSKRNIYYFISILLALFSLLSKPAAIILPFVMITIEYYKEGNLNMKSQWNKVPFVLLSMFFLYMTLHAQTQNNMLVGDFKKFGIGERMLFAFYGLSVYIIKFFVPFHLAAMHPYPKTPGLWVYLSPLLLFALAFLIYYFRKYRKLLIFGLGFFLLNLILVLKFVSIGEAVYAERYTYIPYFGLSFIWGMLLFGSGLKMKQTTLWGIISVYVLFLSFTANARVSVWHNVFTLWTDEIEKYPDNEFGYFNRGVHYAEMKEYQNAIKDYSLAIRFGTNFKTYNNRGVSFLELNQNELALQDFNKSISLKPNQSEAYLSRAHLYLSTGNYVEALKDVDQALVYSPVLEVYALRGQVNFQMQNYTAALSDFNNAISMVTTDFSVYNDRGNVYVALKDYPNAIADYSIVLNQNPNDASVLSNRGLAYLHNNQFQEAISDFNNSNLLDPNSASNYANLAFIFGQLGDKMKAEENAIKARNLGVQ